MSLSSRATLLRLLTAASLSLFIVGCNAGGEEFDLYRQSYSLQFIEGERLLERFSVAERKLWKEINSPEPNTFISNDARYYVDVGDPPMATSIRASLVALKEYNDLLAELANGKAGSRLSTGMGKLVNNLSQAHANLANVGNGPSSVTAAASFLSPAVAAALEIFAKEASKGSFRSYLVQAHPRMKALLLSLRDDVAPKMYLVMMASEAKGFKTDPAQVDRDRKLVASWVVLLDATLAAMDTAYGATTRQNSPITLTQLNDASADLRVLSEKIRDERMRD